MLPDEVALSFAVPACDVDCALALDVPDDLSHRPLRRDRDHHVHMVGHEVSLLHAALLLLGERTKDRTEVAAQRSVQDLAPTFRQENDVKLALPFRVAETLVIVHRRTPFREALSGSRR